MRQPYGVGATRSKEKEKHDSSLESIQRYPLHNVKEIERHIPWFPHRTSLIVEPSSTVAVGLYSFHRNGAFRVPLER